jgi:hypothetical protein
MRKGDKMGLQGSGVLKSEDGEITVEVQYSITPGERKQGRTVHTLRDSFSPPQGKKRSDQIILIPRESIALMEKPGYFILETEDGHCFKLIITRGNLSNIFDAVGSEIECP